MKKLFRNAIRWAIERYRFKRKVDIAWSILGLTIGTAAAYFPWYVYLHQERFSPPEMVFSRNRDGHPLEMPISIGMARSGMTTTKLGGELVISTPVDDISTGTIKRGPDGDVAHPEFQSVDRKILAVYRSGMLLKGPDGIDFVPYDGWIPGAGRIEKIERDGNIITAVTTSGERISLERPGRSQAPGK